MKLTQADKAQFEAICDMTFTTLKDMMHSQINSETKPKAPLLVTAMVSASSRFIGNMLSLSTTIGMEEMLTEVIEAEISEGAEEAEKLINDTSAEEAMKIIRKMLKSAQKAKSAAQ